MIAVDTNVLLRYLMEPMGARNPGRQVAATHKVIDTAESVFISDIVLAEMEWVLESVFALQRKEIATVIQSLANLQRFCFEDWSALQCALMDYREYTGVDLSDCLIARRAHHSGAATLYTFESEKKLGALSIATTFKPPRAR